ncbi:hypothetical protein FJT64_025864 [Amphibalanus amphitrite]|uniref:Uncharacterized protein n=1 Tax=Amphibalanus amphitrite TaxID=1232801 RepID=A0A6A4WIL5_AMPAM|nr:hypothetical protein FJT64_025864 [Amphibalanus amphitrite]
MTHRRTALAVLLCIGVAAVVGGLIAMIWHVVPEQYSLLMRWVAYGLICIGVQCGCLLVRCMCMGPDSSCCPAVDHAVTPSVEGGLATGRHGMRTSRTGGGVVFDPDDKPPAYSQVIYEEGQPPPPFLDALRRESMDEALQAETEAEFIREALRARQAATRRAEMRARKAEIQARNEEGNTAEEAATQQTEAEVEAGQSAAEVETRLTGPPAGDDVGGTQTGTEDSRTEAAVRPVTPTRPRNRETDAEVATANSTDGPDLLELSMTWTALGHAETADPGTGSKELIG